MAPAAVHFQSSATSKSSSLQNPIFNPFSSYNSADDHEQSTNAAEFDVNNGTASRSGLRTGFSKSGRTRPRFLKVRKQLHGGCKGISGECRSGLNPFQSVSESSILDNDCISNLNGFPEKCTSNGNHCPSMSFIFGASSSSCTSNLNAEELCSKEESACSESNSFVFGDRQKNFNGDEDRSFLKEDNGKLGNGDFVFGAKRRQASENEGEAVPKAENGKLQSFVFGASRSSCTSNLNAEELSSKEESACSESNSFVFGERQKNFNGDEDKSFLKEENGKLGNGDFVFGAKRRQASENEGEAVPKAENGKLQSLVFDFGATWNDVERKTEMEKIRECEMDSGAPNVGKVSLGTEVKHGKNSFMGFELGADKSTSGSNLNSVKGESGGSVSDLPSNNIGFCATDNTWRRYMGLSDTGFAFGTSWSNLNDNIESSGNLPNLVNDETVKMRGGDETAHKVNGTAFMFDANGAGNWKGDNHRAPHMFDTNSSCKKSSIATEYAARKCPDVVKSLSEILESCNSSFNAQNRTLDSIGGKCKLASDQHSCSVGNACAAATEFNLTDELQKLNIDGLKNIDGVDNKPSTNGDAFFELGSNVMASASTNGNFGIINEQTSQSLSNAANVATASVGISSPKTFSLQAGVATSAAEQLHYGKVIDEVQVNGTAAPSPSFSFGFDFHRDVGDSMAPPMLQVEENNETCSTSTSHRSGVLFTDFKTPKWDPSSLKASLFPEANEKLESSVKGRSKKDRKPKTMRRKLKHLSQHKQQHEQDQVENEGRIQEALNSPGCYSPMDFSPYEEDVMACSDSNDKQDCSTSAAAVASAEDASGFSGESNHHIEFGFASGLENIDGRKFYFSASSSAPNKVSAAKLLHRKKNRTKVSCKPFVIAANPNIKDQGGLSTSQTILGFNSEANEQANCHYVSPTIAIKEACEMWRLRGNHAYKSADLLKAEDFYTQGIKSVPPGETLGSCLKPLVICYSNRAATRMSLGNMREALRDCAKAAALDPRFLKVQMRAANCHLMLGEIEKAQQYFNKCLESGAAVCLDRRITIEAADGLQKAEKVVECTNHLAKLLERRTSDAAVHALEMIAEALLISPYSEKLLEMKAESMFMLRKYEEVIQLCEQTLCSAENNFTSSGTSDQFAYKDDSQTECYSFARLWRWHLVAKSYFYLGKLELARDLLEKLKQMESTNDKYANRILESSVSLALTVRDLIHHKSAGNEAVRSGRYTEALEHYTAAISSNIESRPFAAICFCNRAAAHQALGQIADAIADCSLAIALDGNYSKAVSRRATLHEMIRDYGQATSDLQRVIGLLENASDGKVKQSPGRSKGSTNELRQARRRLSLMEEETKKGMPLDLYLILGVEQSDSAADIKKAYRKAALKHHPDKAGQFLARSESGDEGRLCKDIVHKVHLDADKLFKMIGEAYAVLSDPTKRSEYDVDEEIRKASKEGNGHFHSRRTADSHSYTYGRRNWQDNYTHGRRNWQDHWKTYGQSHSRY